MKLKMMDFVFKMMYSRGARWGSKSESEGPGPQRTACVKTEPDSVEIDPKSVEIDPQSVEIYPKS